MKPPQLFRQSGQSGLAGRRDFTPKGFCEICNTAAYIHELLCSELTRRRMLPILSHRLTPSDRTFPRFYPTEAFEKTVAAFRPDELVSEFYSEPVFDVDADADADAGI